MKKFLIASIASLLMRNIVLGQDAATKTHHPHHPIFYRRGGNPLIRREGDDLLHVVIQDEAKRVGDMYRNIQDNAGAGLRTFCAPTPVFFWKKDREKRSSC